MNNKHILDLTLRLSQALDQNYDVVSMETVLSVISALEGTTITKEQLEATRLAKYINQLRRRTKCEKLARRAKSLLKRWREMVGMQQSNESAVSCVSNMTAASAINSSSTATAPFNIPSSDNAVSTSHLITQQLSQQHYQRQLQYQTMFKQHQMQQQPYHSQPSSPVNHQEKSNHHEFFISISNPATGAQMPKSSNANLSKKIRCEKNISNDPNGQQQQQPTSFANLISGLGNTLESTRRTTMEKTEPATSTFKAVETFIIEHSSNSNSDLICIPTNNTVSSNFTSATDVPPVVIDLQDTNSSINSLVSKDVANASSSFYRNKISARKLKKEKKRRDRNVTTLQNLPLQDCDDHNTTTASYHLKRPSDVLLLDEKSHSACPTISNISEYTDNESKIARKRRKVWVKDWVLHRQQEGFYAKLLVQLRNDEPELYSNFLRMDSEQFDNLLNLVTPYVQKQDTNMLKSISTDERLVLTLRYLATGENFVSTISFIIPEVLYAIYKVLVDTYLMLLKWINDEEVNKQNERINRRLLRSKSDILSLDENRLNKAAFVYVLNNINSEFKTAKSSAIPPIIKLAAALKFLGQGGYQHQIGQDHHLGISQTTMSRCLTEVCIAVEKNLCPKHIQFEMSEDEKKEAKSFFFKKSNIPGVIGVVDGTHIQMIRPSENEHLYFNRKLKHSMNAMVICDHKMIIRAVDCRYGGACHDSHVWNLSNEKQILKTQYHNGMRGTWILGDSGYPLEPWILTPYRNTTEASAEALFNEKFSKARSIIERVFGIMKGRFRCLLAARELHYDPKKLVRIMNVCCALHNICCMFNVELSSEEIVSAEDMPQSFTDIPANNNNNIKILSLSNSSMSSVFPPADAMSKNIFQSGQNELVSSPAEMTKSDLTFAGKFKQTTSSTSAGLNVSNYNSDSTNVNILNQNSPNRNKISLFGGIEATISNDSSSSSRTTPFHDVVIAVKGEASNSRQNIEDVVDNAIAVDASAIPGAASVDFSSQQIVKQPKKRGRKKGSKGVDSVIAKETNLTSQMLKSSLGVAGKKVKTTKELYAEMENRKLRSFKAEGLGEMVGNANWTGQQQQQKIVRRISFCSDINESDSCTMTSEPSRDSGNILCKTSVSKSELPIDNNINYSKYGSQFKIGDARNDEGSRQLTDKNTTLEITSKIKSEIQEILKLLTPPPSVKEIEYECFNSITPCTCIIEEVTAPADNELNESKQQNSKDSHFNATNSTNISEKDSNHLKIKIEQMTSAADYLKRKDKDQNDILPQPVPPVKVRKSIFDLDFDDDEDPLHSIIADIEGKNYKKMTEITTVSPPVIDVKSEQPLNSEDDPDQVDHQTPHALNVPAPSSNNIFIPSYKVKFDPDCKAKNRFEIQTQKITKFHIDNLHNCFIPNVNGNWNHADDVSTRDREKDEEFILDGYNVVPLYCSDVNEQIPKDLSNLKFTKKFKHSECQNKNEILFYIPFLGVSRILDVAGLKLNSKDINKLTDKDEEKENFDDKLNLNNEKTNLSALDTTAAKEKAEKEMESVNNIKMPSNTIKSKRNKYLKKSGFKRTKRHATSVKRTTIKRPKLNLENLERNKIDSSDLDNHKEIKVHGNLFYHEEICPVVRRSSHFYKEYLFHISSCSSGSSSADEDTSYESAKCRQRTTLPLSSPSSSSSEYHMLNFQQEIIQAELAKRAAFTVENNIPHSPVEIASSGHNVYGHDSDSDDLPEKNNHMLLSFNNIYKKFTRDENTEQQNKDHENNMLKQQLQNCDDYNNLNNNFNLIKYIDNKTSSFNNINNNNTNSCSNYYSDTNINISSSSCSHLHQQQYYKNDNNVQIKPFKEYQTGIRAVDEDVNDDDGNNCGRLQKFKEWHEVLQLRSYNDELLTVLPYVVLE